MGVKAGYSTPMLHVADIEKSIEFYQRLGFETVDTDRGTPIGWARMHCEGGAVMFLRAEDGHTADPSVQGVMFVMYTPDLASLREDLLQAGVKAPAIRYPGYMPSGEMQLADPDGYSVTIVHWGKQEHEAWERRIGAKA
jgi:catechol 2,3-dioxygenase-like lactoylglutathione lyase family enzyme